MSVCPFEVVFYTITFRCDNHNTGIPCRGSVVRHLLRLLQCGRKGTKSHNRVSQLTYPSRDLSPSNKALQTFKMDADNMELPAVPTDIYCIKSYSGNVLWDLHVGKTDFANVAFVVFLETKVDVGRTRNYVMSKAKVTYWIRQSQARTPEHTGKIITLCRTLLVHCTSDDRQKAAESVGEELETCKREQSIQIDTQRRITVELCNSHKNINILCRSITYHLHSIRVYTKGNIFKIQSNRPRFERLTRYLWQTQFVQVNWNGILVKVVVVGLFLKRTKAQRDA